MAYEHEPDWHEIGWMYEHAPLEYRALLPAPKAGFIAMIVWRRQITNSWQIDWISPNGTWWKLFNAEHSCKLDDYTTIYLLTETIKSS